MIKIQLPSKYNGPVTIYLSKYSHGISVSPYRPNTNEHEPPCTVHWNGLCETIDLSATKVVSIIDQAIKDSQPKPTPVIEPFD